MVVKASAWVMDSGIGQGRHNAASMHEWPRATVKTEFRRLRPNQDLLAVLKGYNEK